MRIAIPCGECDGNGRLWTSRYGGNDPDVWDAGPCLHCRGTGIQRCCECNEAAVDIYSHTVRGRRIDHPVCAAHLAEWLEDEAA